MTSETISTIPRHGLAGLNGVQLDARHRRILEIVSAGNGGPAAWRSRKLSEVHDLLALAQISGRLNIERLDISVDLRAVVEMRVTVPLLRSPDAELEVAPSATLGIIYRQEVMTSPQPGYTFVQILSPHPVWLGQVSHDPLQVLCLGTSMPVGFPLREVIFGTYAALTLAAHQLDIRDSAGVMNPAAADWWQASANKIPLSREPFLVTSETKI